MRTHRTPRPTTHEDIPTFLAWERSAGTSEFLGDISRTWHAEVIDGADAEHWCWEDGGLIGFVALVGINSPSVELRRMVVAPTSRGGSGRQLLRWAVTRAATCGARNIWLDVRRANLRARHLYETERFTYDQNVDNSGSPNDLLVLRKVLEADSSVRNSRRS